ncbi:hypothetical protein V501_04586 [Pseudogymnoascus sp. VKM F-4519 (FW-2642)]|nr:hypothetical protein V501_04586 [Pseudogymnoascus sp. VKM F-4519 (FW-2642)]
MDSRGDGGGGGGGGGDDSINLTIKALAPRSQQRMQTQWPHETQAQPSKSNQSIKPSKQELDIEWSTKKREKTGRGGGGTSFAQEVTFFPSPNARFLAYLSVIDLIVACVPSFSFALRCFNDRSNQTTVGGCVGFGAGKSRGGVDRT